MNLENDAWRQIQEKAAGALRPDGAGRALAAARRTREMHRRCQIVAATLTVLLVVGVCASSYVRTSRESAQNMQLWNDAIIAQYAVTRSL